MTVEGVQIAATDRGQLQIADSRRLVDAGLRSPAARGTSVQAIGPPHDWQVPLDQVLSVMGRVSR